jgi:uncharacterized phage protein gp47/JayE
MPLRVPENRREVIDRMRSDVQAVLNNTNPFLRDSLLDATIVSLGGRNFEFYFQLEATLRDLFPISATGEFAEGWAELKDIFRNAASISNGQLLVTGAIDTVVPIGTRFAPPDGRIYVTQIQSTITLTTVDISSLTAIGITATAVTTGPHGFASGQIITISGANEFQYNGSFPIIRLEDTIFSYDVPIGTPLIATGTITGSADMASVPTGSLGFGADQNLAANTQLTITSPVAGLDNIAFALFPGITGGTDIESDEDLRARYLEAYRFPIAQYNVQAVTKAAKSVPGVTRVFVQQTTPSFGFVRIFFMRDNDPDPIPDANEVQKVEDAILKIASINSIPFNTNVEAPTPLSVDFSFSFINPNTTTMQTSIIENLKLFFSERTSVGQDLTSDEYRCAISGTIDIVTGEVLIQFVLSAPIGNIVVNDDEIPILGTVTFL